MGSTITKGKNNLRKLIIKCSKNLLTEKGNFAFDLGCDAIITIDKIIKNPKTTANVTAHHSASNKGV